MSPRDFGQALLDPHRPPPHGLKAWNGSDPAVRFAIHRNNVVVSLVAALADTFPVVRELVGSEFFEAMARLFVAAHPPRSPVLAEYGDAFADFTAAFPPAAGLPYLADVARLERARVLAHHAADAAVLDAGAVAAQLAIPTALPAAWVALHPSVRVCISGHPVVSLWVAHQGQGTLAAVDLTSAEAALVLREHGAGEPVVVPLPLASAAFFEQLADGQSLSDSARLADSRTALLFPAAPPLDLALSLGLLIRHGAISAWHAPQGD